MDALLVINPQNSFLSPQGSVYMGEKAEVLRVRLLDYLSGFQKPKIFIREKHAIEDTFFIGDRTHSVVTTDDYQIHESFKKYTNIICDKTRYDALYKTDLESLLIKYKTRNIGIVGLETHTSILFTVEGLRNRGYEVSVVEPCVVSRDDYLHGCALEIMRQYLSVRIV